VRDGSVELPDRRVLGVRESGPADGPPVLFLTSGFGSRVFDPEPGATAAGGVRLITLDRPGYGASTAYRAEAVPSLADIAGDVRTAIGALGIVGAPVVGWSGGGAIAAALAAFHPDVIPRLVLVATRAPVAAIALPPDGDSGIAPLRADPATAYAAVMSAFAPFAAAPASAIDQIAAGPGDEAVLSHPARRARLEAMLTEALGPGVAGVAAEVVALFVVPWGFEAGWIRARTTLVYGAEDRLVPPAHGHWWAEALRDADLRIEPAAGHLVALTAWPAILAALA
jgi:pimeloyl-ACP methyl ester carboxylesterase